MRVSRLYVEQTLDSGHELVLHERAAHYIHQVLRLRVGQTLTLFNGDGNDHHADVLACNRRQCTLRVGDVIATETRPLLTCHLGMGISRGERMDFAIQKAVELGVSSIAPLLAKRCVVQLSPKRAAQRLTHWRGIVISACEQSGRSRVPALHPPASLADWVAAASGGLMLYHAADRTLPQLAAPSGPVNLLIGPEGGLSDAERDLAVRHAFTAVRLGPRVMRTETAPIAALAALQVLWGDFR